MVSLKSQRNRARMSVLPFIALTLACAVVNARIGNTQVFESMSGSCSNGEGFNGINTWFFGGAVRARTWEFLCGKVGDFPNGYSCEWSGKVNEWNGDMDYNCPTGSFLAGVRSEYEWMKRDHRYEFQCCAPKSPITCTPWWGTHEIDTPVGVGWVLAPVEPWTLTGIFSTYDHGYGDRKFKMTYSGLRCRKECNCPGVADSAWRVVDVKYDLQEARKSSAKPLILESQVFNNNSPGEGQSSFTVKETVTHTSKFSHQTGTRLTVGGSVKVGIPQVAEKTLTVEVSGSYDYTWGEVKAISHWFSSSSSITIKPYTRVQLISKASEYKLEVPYTITLEREEGCRCESKGTWSGVSVISMITNADLIDEDGNVINDKKVTGRSLDLMERGAEAECRMDSQGWACFAPGVRMSEFVEYAYPSVQMDESKKMTSRVAEACFDECRGDQSCVGVARPAGLGLTTEGDCYSMTQSDLEKCNQSGSNTGTHVAWIERGREHKCPYIMKE